MKKFSIFLLVVILILSTTGIKMYQHFCYGELVAIGLLDKKCCDKKSCCSSHEIILKVTDAFEHNALFSHVLLEKGSLFQPAYYFSLISFSSTIDDTSNTLLSESYDIFFNSKKRFISLEVFRI